jgi:hypothetical protein
MRLSFPLATIDTETEYLFKMIGDAHFKMLMTLEVVGGNEISEMVPLKLDDLLGSPELMKHFRGSEKLEQTTLSPSSSGNDELDVEALKLVVGATFLSFNGAEAEQ